MRGNPAYREEQIDFDRYLAYMHGQVEELVTNYGKIDILWFDFAYGELRGEALDAYLFDKLGPYLKVPVDAIVLGCTHYPFLTGAIRRIVGRGPEILDGSHGVAMQLGRRLAAAGMLRTQGGAGTVEFRNSLDEPEILALSRALLQYRED